MTAERELTATYIIMGKSFAELVPYDAKGAFVLLNTITEGLGDAVPGFMRSASHLHMVAALGDNDKASREACRSMVRLVDVLERRLLPDASKVV